MALADLTDSSAVLRAIAEADLLGREGFLEKYGFGPSREYLLRYNDKLYDSKAIVGAAYGYQHPARTPLTASDFSGGERTVQRKLEQLAFTVVLSPDRQDPRSAQRRNPPWNYQELVLAMDLYVRRGLAPPDDADVLELSGILNRLRGSDEVADPGRYRNANGVHLKLANYRAREHPGHGMAHGNKLETTVWERFHDRRDLLAQEAVAIRLETALGISVPSTTGGNPVMGHLRPFHEKADLTYEVNLEGGVRTYSKHHETLVNEFAEWLRLQGVRPLRNRAVDIGFEEPSVIVEAEYVTSWPHAIREAVGQLYEYRFFKVARPDAALVFLASEPVPDNWVHYLEEDRGIGVAWRDGGAFFLTDKARANLGLG